MTDADMQLGQLNNDTTYYDREGKDTEQDVTRWNRLPYPEPRVTTFIPHACMHAFSGLPLDAVSICLVTSYLHTLLSR